MGSTAEPRPSCYAELFQDPTADLFGRDPYLKWTAYARIYHPFECSGVNPPPAADLLEHVLNLFEAQAVGEIGIFVTDPLGTPRLRVIHGVRKYPGNILSPSQNANKVFGFLDEVLSGRGELVRVTTNMFSITNTLRVLSLAQHLIRLEEAPGSEYVGPFGDTDPHT